MDRLQGQLLISGPGLVDPNFRRTIVLIGEHTEEGALGVVLNRPAPVTVAETVPPLADLVSRWQRGELGTDEAAAALVRLLE